MKLRNGKTFLKESFVDTKTRYFKLLQKDLTHHGFTYTPSSLNVDTIQFAPNGQCNPGGLYFFSEEQLNNSVKYFGFHRVHYFAEVTFPDDAQVYHEQGKSKADKIILGELKEYWNDFDMCLKAVTQDGCALNYINEEKFNNEQYYELCWNAINEYSFALEIVKEDKLTQEQYYELCMKSVSKDCLSLKFVKKEKLITQISNEMYYEVCLQAIDRVEDSYNYIDKDLLSFSQYYNLILSTHNCKLTRYAGELFFKEKKYPEAMKFYEFGVEEGDVDSMHDLAVCYEYVEDYEKMKHYYEMAAKKGKIKSMINLGHYYGTNNDCTKMKHYYEMAVNKGSIKALQRLGRFYEKENQFVRAKKYFERAVEDSPEHKKGDALNDLGVFYFSQKKYDEMEKCFLEAIDYGDKRSLYNMGYYCWEILKDFDKMINYMILAHDNGDKDAKKYIEKSKILRYS